MSAPVRCRRVANEVRLMEGTVKLRVGGHRPVESTPGLDLIRVTSIKEACLLYTY
jgi:hypothetical protein